MPGRFFNLSGIFTFAYIYAMKPYFVKTSKILSHLLYPSMHWKISTREKAVYITFDDGPTPGITEPALDILDAYHAKATFFLIADKAKRYPDLAGELTTRGHAVGNHTYHHLNGWKTKNEDYFRDIGQADALIGSNLFRPPYGRITRSQLRHLRKHYHIIMWSILSGDFDTSISPEQCYKNIAGKIVPGSIIGFHDSEKAAGRMLHALPALLETYSRKGYVFKRINAEALPIHR